MGKLARIRRWGFPSVQQPFPRPRGPVPEALEQRVLLAADVHLGAVYFEEATGDDSQADVFQVTFEGGAPGTQLERLVINTDKQGEGFEAGDGLTTGDVFFDIEAGGLGAFAHVGLQIEEQLGFVIVSTQVNDGGTQILFELDGFDAGERLVFSADVDEVSFAIGDGQVDVNSVAEGAEFQRSQLAGLFVSPNYEDLRLDGSFWDQFDQRFAAAAGDAQSTLELPSDRYREDRDLSDRTAGAVAHAGQILVPASVGGFVYHDASNDGVRDLTEDGLAGVEVRLIPVSTVEPGVVERSVLTESTGAYQFNGVVPGEYRIVEVRQPDGYRDGIDTAGTVHGSTRGVAATPDSDTINGVVLAGGEAGVEYNFGEILPGTIRGRVHANFDGNCTFNPGDLLLEGVAVTLLDQSGSVVATALTGADGSYAFEGLAPGTYHVRETQPADYDDGEAQVGTAGGEIVDSNTIGQIVIASGTLSLDNNFCEHTFVSLSGTVYHDQNDNGIMEPGEAGIGGVTLELLDADGQPAGRTTQTDAAGNYAFPRLAQGIYGVRELQPEEWLDGKDSPGTRGGDAVSANDAITGIPLLQGQSGAQYKFGELRPSTIRGRVHANVDGNCTLDPGDIVLEGVQVTLLDALGNEVATTTTAADGNYAFDGLAPGIYTVVETQPSEYQDGSAQVGTAGGVAVDSNTIAEIVIVSGTTSLNNNFCEHRYVSLSGTVYHDRDDDGIQDEGEEGIAGVALELLDSEGRPTGRTNATDSEGNYRFDRLDHGIYGVRERHPEGWLDGRDTPGDRGGVADSGADVITGAALLRGLSGSGYDFGERLPGEIRGHVYVDNNLNCIQDIGEAAISAVVVELLDENDLIVAATTTNAEGAYLFANVVPGTYSVREQQPAEFFEGGESAGEAGVVRGPNWIAEVQVESGSRIAGIDFKEIEPARISGFVFQDGPPLLTVDGLPPDNLAELRDGSRTADDVPLVNVLLELRDGRTGEPILASAALPDSYAAGPIRARTDANGFYQFGGLRPGSYSVFEVHPAEYIDGIDSPGSTGGLAINPHEFIPPPVLFSLIVDPLNDAILRIELEPGGVSVENNFSEVVVARIPDGFQTLQIAPQTAPPPAIPLNVVDVESSVVSPPALLFRQAAFVGAGSAPQFSWHLSVVDAGSPREARAASTPSARVARFDADAWQSDSMDDAVWLLWREEQGDRLLHFGQLHGIPVTGDFNGDGVTEVGFYIGGEWFIDINGNGVWDRGDLRAKLGSAADQPVTGDWNGDGKTDIGIFGPAWPGDQRAIMHEPGLPDKENRLQIRSDDAMKNVPPDRDQAAAWLRALQLSSSGNVREDLIDHVFAYGKAQDIAVAGDWNGDGIETVGVFRNGEWLLDSDGDGRLTTQDQIFQFGGDGDTPVVGDWNDDGIDDLGVFQNGSWTLDSNGDRTDDPEDRRLQFGRPGDVPVSGDFDGDGADEPAVYRSQSEGESAPPQKKSA